MRLALIAFHDLEVSPVWDVLRDAGHDLAVYQDVTPLGADLQRGVLAMVIVLLQRVGEEVERLFRRVSATRVPLLVISPSDEEGLTVRVLQMGADGVLSGRIGEAELLARVEAHLRRHWEWGLGGPGGATESIVIDSVSCSAIVGGREVKLTPTECRLLSRLAEGKGEVVSTDDLRDFVWGLNKPVTSSSLRLFVSHLRRKVEPNPEKPRFIRTKWGLGYYLDSGRDG
jgi:DNA-binding response OmpR family regulator